MYGGVTEHDGNQIDKNNSTDNSHNILIKVYENERNSLSLIYLLIRKHNSTRNRL